MTNELRYRAVMFDLGGTLFNDLPGHISERNQRAALAGVVPGIATMANVVPAFRRARTRAQQRLRKKSFYSHQELVTSHFLEGVANLGVGEAPRDAGLNEAVVRYRELQRASVVAWLRPREDCHATLRGLRQFGCDLTIVSNNDDGYLQALVAKWRLAGYLRAWLSSDAAGVCKPDPGIMLMALTDTDLAPQDVLYVGDSPADDITGARAAGMDVALLVKSDAVPEGGEAADYQIRRLIQLLDIVRSG